MSKAKPIELRPEAERFDVLLAKLTTLTEQLNQLSKKNIVVNPDEFHQDTYKNSNRDWNYYSSYLPGNFPKGMSCVSYEVKNRVMLEAECKDILTRWTLLKAEFETYNLDEIDPEEDKTRLERINAALDQISTTKYSPREIMNQAFHYVSVVMVKERLLWFFDDLWRRVEINTYNLKLNENTMQYSQAKLLQNKIMQAKSNFIKSTDLDSGLVALKTTCSEAYDEFTKKDFETHRGAHNRTQYPIFNIMVDCLRGCLGVINFVINVPGIAWDATLGNVLGSSGTLKYMQTEYVSTFLKTPKTRSAKRVEAFQKGISGDFQLDETQKETLDPTKKPIENKLR